MISDTFVQERKDVCKAKKAFKATYGVAIPILLLITLISGILSMLDSAPGKHTKLIAIIVFAVTFAASVALIVLNNVFSQDVNYKMYEHKINRTLPLSTYLPLTLLTVLIIVPFYILFITSVKKSAEADYMDFSWWPRQGFHFDAYLGALQTNLYGINLLVSFGNSMIYAVIPCLVGLISSAAAAYGYSKLPFRGSKFLFQALLLTIMLPGCVTISSSYVLFDAIGWLKDGIPISLPLFVPACFGGIGTVMFLKEYYAGIPDDLIKAAQIDGAGKLRIFFSFMLPLGTPALIAQFILGFVGRFNDYMGPLLYINEASQYTLQVALRFLDSDPNSGRANMAAAGMIALVPVMLLYFIFQKKILSGISMSSGLKG